MNQFLVFSLGANRNPQTVCAQYHSAAITYNNAFRKQILINAFGIRHFDKQEIGITGIYFQNNGKK